MVTVVVVELCGFQACLEWFPIICTIPPVEEAGTVSKLYQLLKL